MSTWFILSGHRRLLAAGLLIAAVLGHRAQAAGGQKPVTPASGPLRPATTAPTASFDNFRIIVERNIFDPSRIGRTAAGADHQLPRGDTISLVGTMHYEKGLFAFFDGSSASYQKSLHEGDLIAQYTVTLIGNDGVELLRDGQRLNLTIGQQLNRPVGGDWTVVALDAVRSEADAARAQATSPVPDIPADASDTLRRLMEQRQKQLKP